MPITILVLAQVLIVIGCSRLVGWACRWIKQPLVIGEILAGILLGPSFLGLIAPGFAAGLFPPESISYLNVLSQIGLIFFMFLIGLELNPRYLRGQLEVAILTSHVSIIAPFALGTLLALLLYPLVSNDAVSFTAFALFLGAAMSITAFPVLARIITENNLQRTRLGTLALTCAAVDDVTAWCLLALAIAVTRTNSMVAALPTIGYSILYIGLMVTLGRQFLQRLSAHYDRTGRLTQFVIAGIYMGVVLSALITEFIGIHLIFGAFLLGTIMPKNAGLTRELAEKTEDFVLVFLLPVFFAYSGLRTQIGLLNRPELWLLCGAVLMVAIVGKYAGTYVAARVCSLDHREASALGWLMNTRGLTELIVLNIGLSLNVISPLLFTMLVIMALTTTVMTSPLLEWTYPKHLIRLKGVNPSSNPQAVNYRILVPVANPATQSGLLQLAVAIAFNPMQSASESSALVQPLHIIELEEDYAFQNLPTEVDRLIAQRRSGLQEAITELNPSAVRSRIRPIVTASREVVQETVRITELNQTNLMLVGWHRPAFSSNRLGGRVGQILSQANVDVAIFIDRSHAQLERILVPYVANIHDDLGLELALRLLVNSESRQLTVLRVQTDDQLPGELSYEFRTILNQLPDGVRDRIQVAQVQAADPIQAVIQASAVADLTIAGASREWGLERQTLGASTDELVTHCESSLLITRKHSRFTSHLTSVLLNSGNAEERDLEIPS